MRECLAPYLRRSAIIARMMGPLSRSEISGVAMVTAVAILVHSQLSIIGKDKREPPGIRDILLSAKWRPGVSARCAYCLFAGARQAGRSSNGMRKRAALGSSNTLLFSLNIMGLSRSLVPRTAQLSASARRAFGFANLDRDRTSKLIL